MESSVAVTCISTRKERRMLTLTVFIDAAYFLGDGGKIIMDTSEIIFNQKQAASDIDSGVSNMLECPVNHINLETFQNVSKVKD